MSNTPYTSTTIRAARLPRFIPRTEYQVIAALIWICGALATELLVRSLGVPQGISYAVALAVQIVITLVEAPMWRRQANVVSFLVLAADVAINAGGLAPIMERLAASPTYAMLVRLGATDPTMAYGVVVGCAVVVGLVIAAAPERIWRW